MYQVDRCTETAGIRSLALGHFIHKYMQEGAGIDLASVHILQPLPQHISYPRAHNLAVLILYTCMSSHMGYILLDCYSRADCQQSNHGHFGC